MRHWQRTEVREAQEKFKTGQKGSIGDAAQTQSDFVGTNLRNGADGSRQFDCRSGKCRALARTRYFAFVGRTNRFARFVSATLDYILAKTTSLLDSLVVYPENMLKNLNLTRGLVFSGQLLLALTQKGVSREDAYVRDAAKRDEGLGRRRRVTRN